LWATLADGNDLIKTARQVVTKWADAFNRRDAAAAAALYHDDATNIQVSLGEPVRGQQAMRESFTEFFRAFPDSHTQVEHIFEDGEWAIILHWRVLPETPHARQDRYFSSGSRLANVVERPVDGYSSRRGRETRRQPANIGPVRQSIGDISPKKPR
jgi:uncharacterized protein (TIGR02246 family)